MTLPRLIVRPLQEFLSTESAGGVLLLFATAVAITWINAPGGDSYTNFWSTSVRLNVRIITFDESLQHAVNDGLMTLFFFVVGLEIKRELLQGELREARNALLPVAAALGGMIAPALIFLAFNSSDGDASGWGIPMATDIAFAVGILALAGQRVPSSLKVFLLALAIVDDLGAILVIAVFYTDAISFPWLSAALALFALVVVLQRAGVARIAVYALVGLAAWLAMFESGIHATLAGVVLGLLTPAERHGEAAEAPDDATDEGRSVLDRLEHVLHPWSGYVVVPLFALANAGIVINGSAVRHVASSPVSLGVMFGLVAGKPLGVLAFSWLAVRSGFAALPADVRWHQIAAVAVVAGIGFTVSLFITNLAFSDDALVREAKMGILAASALAGAAGYVLLRVLHAKPAVARTGG